MFPGENVLSVEYKGATNLATLTSDGRIECVVRITRVCFVMRCRDEGGHSHTLWLLERVVVCNL